jgi:hypothetical protein
MVAIILEKLFGWIERVEQRRLSDYLSSSKDLGELEQRMRSAEREAYFR